VPVSASDAALLEPAAALLIELRAAPTLRVLNESAPNVTVFGNGNALWLVFQADDAALGAFTIVAEKVELRIVGARQGWPVDSLTADFFSVASLTVAFAVRSRLALAAPAPALAQAGQPAFALAPGAALALADADALPRIRARAPGTVTLSNGAAVVEIAGFPQPLELPFPDGTAVVIGSDYSSSADVNLRFLNGGSVEATNGWAGETVPGVGGAVDLTLREPAAFRYFDGSRFAVAPATLANMEFANIRSAAVTVTTAGSITGFEFMGD
jgi:hypothetical protein